jgi:hypothetical protein
MVRFLIFLFCIGLLIYGVAKLVAPYFLKAAYKDVKAHKKVTKKVDKMYEKLDK